MENRSNNQSACNQWDLGLSDWSVCFETEPDEALNTDWECPVNWDLGLDFSPEDDPTDCQIDQRSKDEPK